MMGALQPVRDDLFRRSLAGRNVLADDTPAVSRAFGARAGCASIAAGVTQDAAIGHVTRVGKRHSLQYF